ncbi:MAG: carbohydrate ABC transporter permease [Clostridiales bacterium]|nr:carbohydrate ABC transporter permease [Clostridiales bacterium]
MAEDKGAGAKAFRLANALLLSLLAVAAFYPIFYVLVASVSDPVKLYAASKVLLFPQGFSLAAYKIVFTNSWIWRSYLNTLFYVVAGGALSIFVTLLGGYALSRKYLPGRSVFLVIVTITMFFSGGLIPTFIIVNGLGLTDTVFAMILPSAVSTYNLLVMKTFLQGLPDEMEETSRIDGANDFTILWKVMAPLAAPALAVVSLFYIVSIWNSYIAPTIYLRNRDLFPLQVILREILLSGNTNSTNLNLSVSGGNEDYQAYSDAVKYATIVVATVPILCVYPFLQRYFVKGVMLGAIKG